jgi:NADH-quinone oxidoreductase subunit J
VNEIAFYIPAVLLVLSAINVAFTRKPVWGLLSLMLCFLSTAVLWMGLGAEFLALALIFIYVGAVMALFLFIVFMLNVDSIPAAQLPLSNRLVLCLLVVLGGGILFHYAGVSDAVGNAYILPEQTKQLGIRLYQDYELAFEVMGIALLAAMLGAIALVLGDRKAL